MVKRAPQKEPSLMRSEYNRIKKLFNVAAFVSACLAIGKLLSWLNIPWSLVALPIALVLAIWLIKCVLWFLLLKGTIKGLEVERAIEQEKYESD